jgi:pimeloyl-ACP methyl ester carboxylesterase
MCRERSLRTRARETRRVLAPETRYARSGDVHIAYQVFGTGPPDLVLAVGALWNIEHQWTQPRAVKVLQRLASFSRVIVFDKRGTGLSDRVPESELPTLERRMDDVRAVMDALECERAVLFGEDEGCAMCSLFAATYPERTSALVLFGSFARRLQAPDYPWGIPRELAEQLVEQLKSDWGKPLGLRIGAPSLAHDEGVRRWWAGMLRASASPSSAGAMFHMSIDTDIRGVLDSVHVPTLVLHEVGDLPAPVQGGRYVAERIAGARFVELPGDTHLFFLADRDELLDEVQEFLTGVRWRPRRDQVLATIVFTDIVQSTERAVEVGEERWADVLEQHHAVVRSQLDRFNGREIDTAGDGFFASFDGPARAVRCACSIRDQVRRLGIEIRAGVHTGECRVIDQKLGGLAVHIGARVAHLAGAGEVLTSGAVKDLVAGSGLSFSDRGTHRLKGIPEPWQLFAVV